MVVDVAKKVTKIQDMQEEYYRNQQKFLIHNSKMRAKIQKFKRTMNMQNLCNDGLVHEIEHLKIFVKREI